MTDALPALPEKSYLGDDAQYGYDAEDMHAYAAAAVEAERERLLAKLLECCPSDGSAEELILRRAWDRLRRDILSRIAPTGNHGFYTVESKDGEPMVDLTGDVSFGIDIAPADKQQKSE